MHKKKTINPVFCGEDKKSTEPFKIYRPNTLGTLSYPII